MKITAQRNKVLIYFQAFDNEDHLNKIMSYLGQIQSGSALEIRVTNSNGHEVLYSLAETPLDRLIQTANGLNKTPAKRTKKPRNPLLINPFEENNEQRF